MLESSRDVCFKHGDLLDEGRRLLHLHHEHVAQGNREQLLDSAHDDMNSTIKARDVEVADRLAHLQTCHFRDRFAQFMDARYDTDFRLDLGSSAPESHQENEG